MELNNLKAFIAVAETTSFSQAAEQLFLTQPAVSKRIAALEEELANPLFDRIGRQVSLTEAGRALLPRALSILEQIDDSRRAISNLSGRVAGRLVLGTSHHIGLHRLPPVLREYIHAYPQVELDIRFMDSEQACRAVEHGDLEMAVVTLPLTPSPVLSQISIWPDPLVVVSARDHALCGAGPIDISLLARHPAILPARGTYTRSVIETALQDQGEAIEVRMETNYLETIKMLVSIGLGWSLLPRTMVDEELVAHDIPGLELIRHLGVVHHTARTLSNSAGAMIARLKTYA